MKKTLLLSALVVTATAFAGTTGKFTIDSKHTATIKSKSDSTLYPTDKSKKDELKNELRSAEHEIKGAGEVVLGESGVTLGGDVKFERKASTLKEANSFVKYGFTTNVEGLDAYIKGNVKTKSFQDSTALTFTGEGQVSYKKDDITYSLNSKTSTVLGSLVFSSVHEAKVEGKKDKIEDLLVLAKLSHGYTKHTATNGINNIPTMLKTDVKGTVKVMDGLKVGAQNKFDILLNNKTSLAADNEHDILKEVDEFPITGKFDFGYSLEDPVVVVKPGKGTLAEMFKLHATYENDMLSATGAGIVEYFKLNNSDVTKVLKISNYGLKLDATYKAIKNLELGANVLFGGSTTFANSSVPALKENSTIGFVKVGANGKYTAKVNDKLTITPKLEGEFGIAGIKAATDTESYKPSLELSVVPEVGVEFKATDSVTLTASGKATVTATRKTEPVPAGATAKHKFKYDSTALEAKLGLKYTW